MIDFNGWVNYWLSAAGFLFLCLVLLNLFNSYNRYRERLVVERIERLLKKHLYTTTTNKKVYEEKSD